jgi:hypothetical protein
MDLKIISQGHDLNMKLILGGQKISCERVYSKLPFFWKVPHATSCFHSLLYRDLAYHQTLRFFWLCKAGGGLYNNKFKRFAHTSLNKENMEVISRFSYLGFVEVSWSLHFLVKSTEWRLIYLFNLFFVFCVCPEVESRGRKTSLH